jgi:hypothetical protein
VRERHTTPYRETRHPTTPRDRLERSTETPHRLHAGSTP